MQDSSPSRVRQKAIVLCLFLTCCTQPIQGKKEDPRTTFASHSAEERVHVIRVLDGDTIRVQFPSGAEETVRFLGINTPEIRHGKKPEECFGTEAKEYAEQKLRDTDVRLIRKKEEDRDHFGRLLRYIELDGVDIGAEELEQGFARHVCKKFPHPRCASYNLLEERAKQAKRGLFGACEKV